MRPPRLGSICDEAIQKARDLDAAAVEAASEYAEALAVLEVEIGPHDSYESGCREEKSQIIDEKLRSVGADADADLAARFKATVESYVERAERYDGERRNREMLAVWGSGPPGDSKLLDDPEARKVWEHVYRPTACSGERIRPPVRLLSHGARHRRAPGRRARHRHGSRRASGVRSGQDPGDGDPEPPAPAPGAERQQALGGTCTSGTTPPDPKGGRL
jgi:hypothetical protein